MSKGAEAFPKYLPDFKSLQGKGDTDMFQTNEVKNRRKKGRGKKHR